MGAWYPKGSEMVSHLLKSELYVLGSLLVDAGKQTYVFCKNNKALKALGFSLTLIIFYEAWDNSKSSANGFITSRLGPYPWTSTNQLWS